MVPERLLGTGREVPACLADKEPLCRASDPAPVSLAWGRSEVKVLRWEVALLGPGHLEVSGSMGGWGARWGCLEPRGGGVGCLGVISAEQKEAETLSAPELSHVILAALRGTHGKGGHSRFTDQQAEVRRGGGLARGRPGSHREARVAVRGSLFQAKQMRET